MKGGKIQSNLLKQMLQSTYKDNPQDNVGQYTLDKSLSNETVLTYVDPVKKEVKIAIRGTKGAVDWIPNLLYATKTGLQRLTPRFTKAQKIVDNARKKYSGYTIEFLAHSQGSIHARDLAKNNESIVSVNPATKGEYTPNEQVIRSSGDAVSALGVFPSWYKSLTKTNKDITTAYNSNPIAAHRLDILDELGETVVGAGMRCSCCGHMM
tara:strand:+ start:194 stop:820 length:627 start_codon:yes stop_codon:yes gene_type:complete